MIWEILLVLTCLAVATGCLVPNAWLPPLPNDKLMHAGAFGAIAALALPLARDRVDGAWILAGVLGASWLIECLQQLVPDRTFCWRDLRANAAGVALAGLGALAYSAWRGAA